MINVPSTFILVEELVPELYITSIPTNPISDIILAKLFRLTLNTENSSYVSLEWIVDSECTAHMTNDRSVLSTYSNTPLIKIDLRANSNSDVFDHRYIAITLIVKIERNQCVIKNVENVPELISAYFNVYYS